MSNVDEIMALVQQLGTAEHNQDDGQAVYFEKEIRKAIEALAQPAGEAEPVTDFASFEVAVKEYIDEYEMLGEAEDGRDACYMPSEDDKALLLDAFMGFDFSLYTTPQQSKPLTDEQIMDIQGKYVGDPTPSLPLDTSDWLQFARAIEVAHNIKGVTE